MEVSKNVVAALVVVVLVVSVVGTWVTLDKFVSSDRPAPAAPQKAGTPASSARVSLNLAPNNYVSNAKVGLTIE